MDYVLLIPVLLVSFVVHEFAHAWVALREGDPTAYQLGRVTLNPIPHIDLFGTILIPAMLIASGSNLLFGWAKPVPVISRNFRNYRRGDILVSLAGVAANFLLALICTLLMIGSIHLARALPEAARWMQSVEAMALVGIRLNFILVVFNLLPIPPLDGSHLLYHVLPPALGARLRSVERFGILVFVLLMFTGAFTFLLRPAFWLERFSLAWIQSWT